MLPAHRTDISTRATEAQVLQALASLAGLPSRLADDAELDRKMYHVALDGVSRHALNEAVKAIIRGVLGHTFFPSPVEFRQQCDKAIEPHIREASRIRRQLEQAKENAAFNRVIASRTPEAVARQQATYAAFCASHEPAKAKEQRIHLDPELLAKIPDAPSAFKHAKVA